MESTPAYRSAAKALPALVLAAVLSVLPSRAETGTGGIYESGVGRLRITVISVTSPGRGNPAPRDSSDPAPQSAKPDACISADSLGDFASPAGICRNGDALLDVAFYDKAAMRELRFPLKYSELRRHLLKHPLAYREGSADERAVRLIADLSRRLKIEMREPGRPGEKP